jgi:hypothetical protein
MEEWLRSVLEFPSTSSGRFDPVCRSQPFLPILCPGTALQDTSLGSLITKKAYLESSFGSCEGALVEGFH